MWPITSCSTKCARKRPWTELISGSDERQHVAHEPLHLLGDLHAGHALAHQRLVHVEVDQAHLRVGDLGERLPVHAHQLQEGAAAGGPRRASRRRSCSICMSSSETVCARQRAQPHGREDPLDQPGLQPGGARGLPQRVARLGAAQQGLERTRTASWPRSLARLICSSVCPRARSRATTRTYAAAAGVQRPS